MSLLDKTDGKEFAIFKLILLIAAVFLIYKLLDKFGLMGLSDAEKNAQKLSEGEALNDALDKNSKLGKAILKSTGKSLKTLNASDVKAITPNRPNMNNYVNQIWDAKGTFKDNEDMVYNVFRNLYSQFEINFFSKYFSVTKKRDLYGFLATFMNTNELSTLQNIIKSKKLA